MTIRAPFKPHYGANQVVTPAAAAAAVAINGADKSVRLVNSGASICYVRIAAVGDATTADLPVRSGESIVVEKAEGEIRLSHISAVGTTLNIMTGEGGGSF